ncbi:uncharacterized protein EI90DRAFT_480570 [Cantharellus anzutake]|uniref:uncharacterized protein n=1 Tax=Cantharellus anzutake TaxID=1750568 RepID=UPI0019075F81|nr:uncharacterized protein EI90DRAFT_480570 [Cantharellus anzutake]KAF8313966.1 hypothetical protein EI90DRAFT_480570 [Cantharellus anzutake]
MADQGENVASDIKWEHSHYSSLNSMLSHNIRLPATRQFFAWYNITISCLILRPAVAEPMAILHNFIVFFFSLTNLRKGVITVDADILLLNLIRERHPQGAADVPRGAPRSRELVDSEYGTHDNCTVPVTNQARIRAEFRALGRLTSWIRSKSTVHVQS